MHFKGVEVAVGMEQHVVALYAPCGNERVYRLPNREAKLTQFSEVLRSLYRYLAPHQINLFKRIQSLSHLLKLTLVPHSLQHLGKNQVTHGYARRPKQYIELFRLWCSRSAEEIDPHAGVNQYHLSVLIASKLPSQVILPLSCLACCCLPN